MHFRPWLQGLSIVRSRRAQRKPFVIAPASVEVAEPRCLLSANISLNPTTGVVTITGTPLDEQADVALTTTGQIQVTYKQGLLQQREIYVPSSVTGITFGGQAGNDKFTNRTSLPSTVSGGLGNDSLSGGSGVDQFSGDDGADSLDGLAGNDILEGGLGNDTVKGGEGGDALNGSAGLDSIYGGNGDDTLNGGDEADKLYGEAGADVLQGNLGNDTLDGGLGNDTLRGEDGNDSLSGGDQNDLLEGALGNDTLGGGNGDDSVKGGAGNDKLTGSAGLDTLDGAEGNDSLYGGNDADVLIGGVGIDSLSGELGDDSLFGGDDIDTLSGSDGNDSLEGGNGDDSLSAGNGDDSVKGGSGNDKLSGSAGLDTLEGEGGNDSLYGGNDADVLIGGVGIDSLSGELGDDSLFGGDDIDTLSGSDGNDSLEGGNGDDSLSGGNGNDSVKGGSGNDKLSGSAGLDTLDGEGGNDSLDGGIDADSLLGGAGLDSLSGDLGDDVVLGGDDADTMSGSEGNDTVDGGNGDDTLSGSTGNDLVLGGAGADLLFGSDHDDVLRGGDGNDTLSGYLGNDALLGEGGDDSLSGSDGRDLLIGGTGVDLAEGGSGDDILIGGTTTYDADNASLRAIVTSWAGASDYATRVAALQAATANPRLQSDETVVDDGAIDGLFGGSDQDWFFLPGSGQSAHVDEGDGHSHLGRMPQNLDSLTDRQDTEQINSKIPHAGNPTLMREHFALFALVDYAMVTHTAIESGSWSNPAVWQNGVVPTDDLLTGGPRVLIASGVTVTVDSVLPTVLKTVRVDGTLRFAPDVNSELRVETMIIDGKGTFEMGTSTSPIEAGVQARLLIDGSQPIDVAEDPLALGHGLIAHGKVTIYGQAVTPFITLSTYPAVGATELVLSSVPADWNVGDKLVIAATDRNGLQDEQRTILGISGNVVQIAALQFSHVPPQAGLAVHVANLTRNAVIESSNTALDLRGHVMFMHTRKVDVNYAGLYHLGRTDKTTPVNDPVVDADGHRELGTGTNPRGRYAMHFHRNGVVNDGLPSKVRGTAVVDSPGWGYVNHGSFVDFTDNLSYDVVGAGFVTEAGDEIGSFSGNLAIRGEGSGAGINDRDLIQDFGHQGDGFWFQGPGIRVENNVASGQRGQGFVFFTRGLIQEGLGTTRFSTANLSDPTIANGQATVEVGIVPILNFRNNQAYASRIGAATRFHQLNSMHNIRSVIENLTLWNNITGFNDSYTNQTTIRNVTIIGDVNKPEGTGVSRNDVTRNIRFENLSIEGYSYGLQVPSRGQNVIEGGYFNNVRNIVIRTAVGENRSVLITGNITFGTLSATALRGKIQQNIVMEAMLMPQEATLFMLAPDSITLNFGSFASRRLYFNEQAASFVPFPVADGLFIPPEYVGKTNEQLFTEFGVALGGAIAPADAVTIPGIVGLLAP